MATKPNERKKSPKRQKTMWRRNFDGASVYYSGKDALGACWQRGDSWEWCARIGGDIQYAKTKADAFAAVECAQKR